MPRFESWPAGWEARTLLLCYADRPPGRKEEEEEEKSQQKKLLCCSRDFNPRHLSLEPGARPRRPDLLCLITITMEIKKELKRGLSEFLHLDLNFKSSRLRRKMFFRVSENAIIEGGCPATSIIDAWSKKGVEKSWLDLDIPAHQPRLYNLD